MLNPYRKEQTGFTIVELVIVIVVISILATLTVIAYRGIQEEAKTAVINSAASQWKDALRIAASRGATIDVTDGMVCLGRSANDFPAADGFAAGECLQYEGGSATYREDAYRNWPSIVARPNGRLPVTTYTNSEGDTFRARGVFAMMYGLMWVPQVKGQCGSGEVMGDTPADETNSLFGDMCIESFIGE